MFTEWETEQEAKKQAITVKEIWYDKKGPGCMVKNNAPWTFLPDIPCFFFLGPLGFEVDLLLYPIAEVSFLKPLKENQLSEPIPLSEKGSDHIGLVPSNSLCAAWVPRQPLRFSTKGKAPCKAGGRVGITRGGHPAVCTKHFRYPGLQV